MTQNKFSTLFSLHYVILYLTKVFLLILIIDNWDNLLVDNCFQAFSMSALLLVIPLYKYCIQVFNRYFKKHPMISLNTVFLFTIFFLIVVLCNQKTIGIQRFFYWVLFFEIFLGTMILNRSNISKRIKLFNAIEWSCLKYPLKIEFYNRLNIPSNNFLFIGHIITPDNNSNTKIDPNTTFVFQDFFCINVSEIKNDNLEKMRLQNICKESIEKGIIRCENYDLLYNIKNNIPFSENDKLDFIYQKNNKQPSIRDLIIYILLLIENVTQDAYKPNNNMVVIECLLENSITLNNQKLNPIQVDSSAVSKARKKIKNKELYSLFYPDEIGQS